jgi:hypothetical protein
MLIINECDVTLQPIHPDRLPKSSLKSSPVESLTSSLERSLKTILERSLQMRARWGKGRTTRWTNGTIGAPTGTRLV